ncbi:MAG: EamA family transporter RarD [Candidatus Promineifilaceae bacterium]
MNKGMLYAVGAYTLWGFFPIYWKMLQDVPASEILGHRMVWSFLFVTAVLAFQRRWDWLEPILKNRRVLLLSVLTGFMLAVNWLVFLWAVNNGFIVESSLGYFINPLVSVVMGVLFLRERLRPVQWTAVAIAAVGVIYLTVGYGSPPWIALTLAGSFGLYGLLRKTGALNSIQGLAMETAAMFPFAILFLLYLAVNQQGHFIQGGVQTTLLLALGGAVTAVPLILFAAGARRIPLSMVGILQYIAPTLQFLIGVFVYHEPFTKERLVGFGIIWFALFIYTVEGLVIYSKRPSHAAR